MPLPSPRVDESHDDFISRCVIDTNVQNDFRTIEQRVAVCNSLYEQEKQIKQVKDTWQSAFENELTKAERSSNRDFYLYYQAEYDKAIKMFISQGGISTADVQVFFKEDTLIKMYSEMYAKVGLQFARWYSKNFDKFIVKSINLKDYESIWQANFAFIGSQVGGQRVSGVSGTAKQTIISVIQKLMKDPEFQIQGERVKARILKSQFTQYSTYQARRVVRTESTNAANYATYKSASDIFAGQDMQKMWMAGRDARVRPAHQAAHRQIVDYNKPFIVGGEQLKWPGDPAGSASNVINCRCSFAPIPKPNAQTIGENITDIGFNLARNTIQSEIGGALITPEVAATIAVETQQVEANAQKELMRPDNWDDIVPKNAKVNDDYLVLLKEKPKMFSSTTESFAQGNNITIDIVRFDEKSMPGVLAHEFGHIIHKQQNWITRFNVDPIVDKYFKKHQKMVGVGLRGDNRLKLLRDYYEKLRQMNTVEFRNLFAELSENEYLEFRGATRDFFGALTKNVIGGGHSTNYYNNKNFDRMEWMAHIFENKYVGNPLFKKLFPEIYDETIQIIDELIANIK
jgi:hypothetical protein